MLESGTAERGQCGIVVRWDIMWVCGTMGIRISFSREQGGSFDIGTLGLYVGVISEQVDVMWDWETIGA